MNRHKLEGKVAIVTGGRAGRCLGIARRLHTDGAAVVVPNMIQPVGRERPSHCQAVPLFQTDGSCREQVLAAVEQTLDQLGAVDILVNNAYQRARPGRLEDRAGPEFERAFKGRVHVCLVAMKACFPSMRTGSGGESSISVPQWRQCPPLYSGVQFCQRRVCSLSRTAARSGQVRYLRQYPLSCGHDPGL